MKEDLNLRSPCIEPNLLNTSFPNMTPYVSTTFMHDFLSLIETHKTIIDLH